MNHQAFTLIELLVVVAIIGILAAVGVVAYNGYTASAKQNAAKANHATVVKYIANEIMKCELGEINVMNGNLKCSVRAQGGGTYKGGAVQNVIDAAVKALSDIKNPYGEMDQNLPAATRMNAVTDGGSYSSDKGVGYVRLQTFSAKVIRIGTCYAIPCYVNKNNYNYFETDVSVVE